MHAAQRTSLSAPDNTDWWTSRPVDLELIARIVVGSLPGGWVRRGDNFVRVGQVKYGSDARKLEAELVALATETKRFLSEASPVAVLRAAAFFHLRFENIHPLVEANGRIGRLILAAQLEQSLKFPARDTLQGLQDWEADYYRLFATNNPPVMFGARQKTSGLDS